MDRSAIIRLGQKAQRENLQRMSLADLMELAKERGIGLPSINLFAGTKQEARYKQDVINEIVSRDPKWI